MSAPFIKICGITSAQMAFDTAQLGANFIGLVFHQHSKRHVTITLAKEIAQAAREGGSIPVGVFVEQENSMIETICSDVNLEIAQLHGTRARAANKALPQNIARIYAVSLNAQGENSTASVAQIDSKRDFLLFDGLKGGSGVLTEFSNIKCYAGDNRFFIAGGLSKDNIAAVIHQYHPFAVDVSSGVETVQGNKSLNMIEQFIEQVHNATTQQ